MKKYIFTTIIFLFPFLALAKIEYKITTPIPGLSDTANTDLGTYLATLFQFGLAIVGLVAFAMIVFNGVKYILGANSESLVSDAKAGIKQTIVGILLLLASITILDTINPCILRSINLWRDREYVDNFCATNQLGFRTDEQIEEGIVDNIQSGQIDTIRVVDGGGTLEIAGIDTNDNNKPTKIIVRKDGSYEVLKLEGAAYISTGIRGDDINSSPENLSYLENYESNKDKIEKGIRDYLIRETSRLSGGEVISTTVDSNDPLKFNIESNFKYRVHNVYGSISCQEVSQATQNTYYKCFNNNDLRAIEIGVLNPQPKDVNTTNIFYVDSVEEDSQGRKIIENKIFQLIDNKIKFYPSAF